MATIRKRGDGWSVQVRRKGYPAEYRTFLTKADAVAWARERDGRIDRCDGQGGTRLASLSLGDLLRRYRDDVAPLLRGSGPEIARVEKMLRAPICGVTLDKLSASPFASYRDSRLKEVMPATVKRELAIFGRVLNLARKEWDIGLTSDPLAALEFPAFNNARDRRLSPEESARLFAALARTRNPLIGPAIRLAIATGMRRGELVSLQWRHVDTVRRTAFLPMTKNGLPRTVPLSDDAIRALAAIPRTDERVLPLTPLALRLAWVRLTKRARLEDLHFHDLRHEAISRFAEMSLTTPELALISGHRDIRMLARYTHLRPTDLAMKLAGRSWEAEGTAR